MSRDKKNDTALEVTMDHGPASSSIKQLEECENFQSLSLSHRKFVLEYLKEYNATKAYKNIYKCSSKAANAAGSRLLVNVNVQKALMKVFAVISQEDDATAEELRRFWTHIVRGKITDVVKWTEDGLLFTANADAVDPSVAKLVKKIRVTERTSQKGDWTETKTEIELHDPLEASKLLGQAHGMFKTVVQGNLTVETYEQRRKRLGLDEMSPEEALAKFRKEREQREAAGPATMKVLLTGGRQTERCEG